MTRDDVLKEFHQPYDVEIVPGLRRGGMQLNTDAMADEIVRLRKELAQPLTHEAIMKRVADDVGRVMANALDGPRSPFMNREHNPGSLEAVVAGCTCSVMDNHGGQGTLIRYDEAHQPIRAWWIGADCPLHSEPHPTTVPPTKPPHA